MKTKHEEIRTGRYLHVTPIISKQQPRERKHHVIPTRKVIFDSPSVDNPSPVPKVLIGNQTKKSYKQAKFTKPEFDETPKNVTYFRSNPTVLRKPSRYGVHPAQYSAIRASTHPTNHNYNFMEAPDAGFEGVEANVYKPKLVHFV